MNIDKLTAVLAAFTTRLHPSRLDMIRDGEQRHWQATLNGSNAQQADAAADSMKVLRQQVAAISEYDRELIAKTIHAQVNWDREPRYLERITNLKQQRKDLQRRLNYAYGLLAGANDVLAQTTAERDKLRERVTWLEGQRDSMIEEQVAEGHWTDKHILRDGADWVAYDEAGREHSRHSTRRQARTALSIYDATQLHRVEAEPVPTEVARALAELAEGLDTPHPGAQELIKRLDVVRKWAGVA